MLIVIKKLTKTKHFTTIKMKVKEENPFWNLKLN